MNLLVDMMPSFSLICMFSVCTIRGRVEKNVCSAYFVSLNMILLKNILKKHQLINSFTIHMKNKLEIIL